MGVCVFRCNLPPAPLAEWLGSSMCCCDNTGVEQTPNKSQHTKLSLEKKIIPLLLPGFELATFQSQVWSSYQQAIPAWGSAVLNRRWPHQTKMNRTSVLLLRCWLDILDYQSVSGYVQSQNTSLHLCWFIHLFIYLFIYLYYVTSRNSHCLLFSISSTLTCGF